MLLLEQLNVEANIQCNKLERNKTIELCFWIFKPFFWAKKNRSKDHNNTHVRSRALVANEFYAQTHMSRFDWTWNDGITNFCVSDFELFRSLLHFISRARYRASFFYYIEHYFNAHGSVWQIHRVTRLSSHSGWAGRGRERQIHTNNHTHTCTTQVENMLFNYTAEMDKYVLCVRVCLCVRFVISTL